MRKQVLTSLGILLMLGCADEPQEKQYASGCSEEPSGGGSAVSSGGGGGGGGSGGSGGSTDNGMVWTLTTTIDHFSGGSGDDTFLGTDVTLTTGDQLTGGAGDDTLKITVTSSSTVSGFQTSGIETIEVLNYSGVFYLDLSGTIVPTVKISGNQPTTFINVPNTVDAVAAGTGDLTISYSASVYSLYNQKIKLSGYTGNSSGVGALITLNHSPHSVSIETEGSASAIQLAAGSTTEQLTVSGTADLEFTNDLWINNPKISIIDASSLTGGLSFTTAASSKPMTVQLGNAATSKTNTILLGSGTDVVTGGSGVDNLTLGTGNDVVTAGGGADLIFPGGGMDTINLTETTSARDQIYFDVGGSANVDTITGFTFGTDMILFHRTIGGNLVAMDNSPITSSTPTSVVVHTTGTATIQNGSTDNGTVVFIDNTSVSTFSSAMGTNGSIDPGGGSNVDTVAIIWFDSTNSQAVFGYVTHDDVIEASASFYEVVRVNLSPSAFTSANLQSSFGVWE